MLTISLYELWNFLTEGEQLPYNTVESAFGFVIKNDDMYEFNTTDGQIACYDGDDVWVIEQVEDRVHLKAYGAEGTTFFLSREEFEACIEDTGD